MIMFGIIASVAKWVLLAGSAVVGCVKTVAGFTGGISSIAGHYQKGKKFFNEKQSNTKERNEDDVKNDLQKLRDKIRQNRSELSHVDEKNFERYNKLKTQIKVMELIISSQVFERFANNMMLHASNLDIHFTTMKNVIGIVKDVNRHRVAIKALISNVNHIGNVINFGSKTKIIDRIEGIDVEMVQEAISIKDSYEAFQAAKNLLSNEVSLFGQAIDYHLVNAQELKDFCSDNPSITSEEIEKWIEEIIPKLTKAKEDSELIGSAIRGIPELEM